MLTSIPRPRRPPGLALEEKVASCPPRPAEAPLISTALSSSDSQRNCNLKNTGGQDCEKEIQVNTRKAARGKGFCSSYRMALPGLGSISALEVARGAPRRADLVDLARGKCVHRSHSRQLTLARESRWGGGGDQEHHSVKPPTYRCRKQGRGMERMCPGFHRGGQGWKPSSWTPEPELFLLWR